jgi:DNA repair exonuclease SbcCD ATPase subunit
MAPVIPNLPTDNLYKFLALFGLVLFVFGAFFPEEKLARSVAQVRDGVKALEVAKIRLTRKNAELVDALEQIEAKVAEQGRNKQQLEDAATKLQAKSDSLGKSLVEQAKRNLKSKAAKDLYAQTKALDPEYQALNEKVRQNTDALKKSTDDLLRLRPRQAEFSDEIAIEMINVKTFGNAVDEFNRQITEWYSVAIGSILIGFVMMVSGFRLWYKKIQVYQDAILRKQAGNMKEPTEKTE